MKRDVAPERARELFNYCPETGQLTWKVMDGRKRNPVGTRSHYGYLVVNVDGVQVKAHRIVWAICNGPPGDFLVDHINRNKADNRIENLRLCTNAQNLRNQSPVSKKKGKPVGVRWLTRRNKWAARITFNGTEIHLGCFNSQEEAAAARLAAAYKLHGDYAPSEAKSS
jgi:hypothetical protein